MKDKRREPFRVKLPAPIDGTEAVRDKAETPHGPDFLAE